MIEIEFTDNTLVATQSGVMRLTDLIRRPIEKSLWAVQWQFRGVPNGISFHCSHKGARDFARMQMDSVVTGPARLVVVSDWLYDNVQQHEYCWTNLTSFEEAKEYTGPCNQH